MNPTSVGMPVPLLTVPASCPPLQGFLDRGPASLRSPDRKRWHFCLEIPINSLCRQDGQRNTMDALLLSLHGKRYVPHRPLRASFTSSAIASVWISQVSTGSGSPPQRVASLALPRQPPGLPGACYPVPNYGPASLRSFWSANAGISPEEPDGGGCFPGARYPFVRHEARLGRLRLGRASCCPAVFPIPCLWPASLRSPESQTLAFFQKVLSARIPAPYLRRVEQVFHAVGEDQEARNFEGEARLFAQLIDQGV